jgi:hypothetical protein
MDDKQKKKELNFGQKYFFGVGDLGFNFMSNIETYYFSYFLTNVAAFPMALVTLISTIGSTVDAVLSWTYGIILNKMKPMKWGRYRSIIAIFPWLVPFLYLFQFKAFGNGIVAYRMELPVCSKYGTDQCGCTGCRPEKCFIRNSWYVDLHCKMYLFLHWTWRGCFPGFQIR